MSALLKVDGLNLKFGSVVAADNICVSVEAGEIVGIIGSNGAGKTTFVNMVTGWLKPDSGSVAFNGSALVGKDVRSIQRLGISRSFQVAQLFDTSSALQNLIFAIGIAEGDGWAGLVPLQSASRRTRAEGILEQLKIADYRDQPVSTLPQGVRKLLDIAMAMVSEPKLLLLDEPTSGVSIEEKFPLMDVVMQLLREAGVTVLFVEHDMEIVERYVSRVLAFYQGGIIADAPPDEALSDPKVREFVIGDHLAEAK